MNIDWIIYFVSIIINYVYLAIYLKHEFHMFQQNSYMNKRYIKWYRKYFDSKFYLKPLILLFLIPVIYLGYEWMAFITAIVYVFVLIITIDIKKEKKKFVITKRVIRLFITTSILIILNTYLAFLVYFRNFLSLDIYMTIQYLIMAFPQLIVLLANLINRPIEKAINQYYINDAKKILTDKKDLKIIGITGSYGKTSTKHILKTILDAKYNVLITPESYNTTLGVVRTIREKLRPIHDVFIVEMGAKKTGDIKEICDVVKPQYGIITKIGNQHLDTFKTFDNIRRTKLELFNSLPLTGTAFVNKDDKEIMKGVGDGDKNYVYFSKEIKDVEYYLTDISQSIEGLEFTIQKRNGESERFKTKLLGINNASNILSAVACANSLGISLEEIKYKVAKLKPVPHRLELKKTDKQTYIIDDAYNSNEKGSTQALNVLSQFKDRSRFLITPGMVELGKLEEEINYNFGRLAQKSADYIILVGKKQTKPIYKGIKDAGFDMEKCFVVDGIKDAFNVFNENKTEKNVVLLENDLPDLFR